MVVTPIIRYKSPHYPDKQTALKDPLLLKNLPRRWAGRAATVTAVTATAAMMLTGCASSESEIASSTAASLNPASSLPASVAVSSVAAAASSKTVSAVSTEPGFVNDKIAPLFIHGNGVGSFGCSSAAPAAFLNEEDAHTIIQDELRRVGINISKEPVTITMAIPILNVYNYPATVSYETGELIFDGADKKNKIAYEYVSDNDVFKYLKTAATGGSLPCKLTAQSLIEKLTETPTDYVVATFYNPHSYVSPRDVDTYFTSQQTAEFQKLDQAEMEKNLRLQVADFIAWLKAEGII